MSLNSTLVDAFTRVLELSKVEPGQSAAIVTDGEPPGPYVEVAQAAFARVGVPVFHLDISATAHAVAGPPSPGSIGDLFREHPGALAALKEVDFVLDFLTMSQGGFLHDKSRPALSEAGTRMLHVGDPPEVLVRHVPTIELRDRSLRARDRMRAAKEFRVTSPAGTDFTVDLEGAVANALYGFVENPGQAGAWPGGFVAAYPVSNSARGRVVLAPGDMNLTSMSYVTSPVVLEWEDDHIVDISGDGLDAELMRDYMAIWNEPEAYGLSHVGWGLNHDAHWWTMSVQHPIRGEFMDGRTFAGNFLISTGVNVPLGRQTRSHFDLPMRHCTITLDGVPVVQDGVLVEEPAPVGAGA
jgi:2,5-dihydroxypyridine 5,6-dioxygenase